MQKQTISANGLEFFNNDNLDYTRLNGSQLHLKGKGMPSWHRTLSSF